jgi:hypothetical protein
MAREDKYFYFPKNIQLKLFHVGNNLATDYVSVKFLIFVYDVDES